MDLVYIWYDYWCWPKILFSIIHTSADDLDVKVTDLKKKTNDVIVLRQSILDLLISKSLHGLTLYVAWL